MTVLSFKVFGTVLSVPSNTRTRGGRFTGKLEIGKIDSFFDWKIHRWNEQSITQNEPRFNIPFHWRIFCKFWLRPKWRKLVNTNGKNALKSVNVAEFGSQCWILTKMYIRKLAHFYRRLFCLCVGQVRAAHHTNVCKISWLCWAISLLALDKLP